MTLHEKLSVAAHLLLMFAAIGGLGSLYCHFANVRARMRYQQGRQR